MTDNRMKAKRIKGEHCRFCGKKSVPLIQTLCCQQFICCDTSFVSFRGGDRCHDAHERFSLCYSHYSDGHSGDWKTCKVCKDFWTPYEYKEYSENSLPEFCNK